MDDDIQYLGTRLKPQYPFERPYSGPVVGFTLQVDRAAQNGEEAMLTFHKAISNTVIVGRRPHDAGNNETTKAMFRCPVVSRSHARFTFSDSGLLYITDTDSHHGTHVRKPRSLTSATLKPETPTRLEDGDFITFGKSVAKSSDNVVRPITVKVELLYGSSSTMTLYSSPKTSRVPGSTSTSGRFGVHGPSGSDDMDLSDSSSQSSRRDVRASSPVLIDDDSDNDSDIVEIPPPLNLSQSKQSQSQSQSQPISLAPSDASQPRSLSVVLPSLSRSPSIPSPRPIPALVSRWSASCSSPVLSASGNSIVERAASVLKRLASSASIASAKDSSSDSNSSEAGSQLLSPASSSSSSSNDDGASAAGSSTSSARRLLSLPIPSTFQFTFSSPHRLPVSVPPPSQPSPSQPSSPYALASPSFSWSSARSEDLYNNDDGFLSSRSLRSPSPFPRSSPKDMSRSSVEAEASNEERDEACDDVPSVYLDEFAADRSDYDEDGEYPKTPSLIAGDITGANPIDFSADSLYTYSLGSVTPPSPSPSILRFLTPTSGSPSSMSGSGAGVRARKALLESRRERLRASVTSLAKSIKGKTGLFMSMGMGLASKEASLSPSTSARATPSKSRARSRSAGSSRPGTGKGRSSLSGPMDKYVTGMRLSKSPRPSSSMANTVDDEPANLKETEKQKELEKEMSPMDLATPEPVRGVDGDAEDLAEADAVKEKENEEKESEIQAPVPVPVTSTSMAPVLPALSALASVLSTPLPRPNYDVELPVFQPQSPRSGQHNVGGSSVGATSDASGSIMRSFSLPSPTILPNASAIPGTSNALGPGSSGDATMPRWNARFGSNFTGPSPYTFHCGPMPSYPSRPLSATSTFPPASSWFTAPSPIAIPVASHMAMNMNVTTSTGAATMPGGWTTTSTSGNGSGYGNEDFMDPSFIDMPDVSAQFGSWNNAEVMPVGQAVDTTTVPNVIIGDTTTSNLTSSTTNPLPETSDAPKRRRVSRWDQPFEKGIYQPLVQDQDQCVTERDEGLQSSDGVNSIDGEKMEDEDDERDGDGSDEDSDLDEEDKAEDADADADEEMELDVVRDKGKGKADEYMDDGDDDVQQEEEEEEEKEEEEEEITPKLIVPLGDGFSQDKLREIVALLGTMQDEIRSLDNHRRKYKTRFNLNVRTMSEKIGELNDLSVSFDALKDTVDSQNVTIGDISTSVTDLSSSVDDIKETIEALRAEIEAMQRDAGVISDMATGLHSSVNDLEERMDRRPNEEVPDVEESVKALKDIADQMSALRTQTNEEMLSELESLKLTRQAAENELLAITAMRKEMEGMLSSAPTPSPFAMSVGVPESAAAAWPPSMTSNAIVVPSPALLKRKRNDNDEGSDPSSDGFEDGGRARDEISVSDYREGKRIEIPSKWFSRESVDEWMRQSSSVSREPDVGEDSTSVVDSMAVDIGTDVRNVAEDDNISTFFITNPSQPNTNTASVLSTTTRTPDGIHVPSHKRARSADSPTRERTRARKVFGFVARTSATVAVGAVVTWTALAFS